MNQNTTSISVCFVCPRCKRPLRSAESALECSECYRMYPLVGGIPDFLSGDESAILAPVFGGTSGVITIERMAKRMDLFAHIYESRIFVAVLLKLSGISGSSSRFIERIANFHCRTLQGITGTVLDVACGPASYGRRIASSSCNVYGIDISMGMLKQGKAYLERDNIRGVQLARARVENLPFGDAVFDGVICSGSLHLFPDTAYSLREICRTMKAHAPLSVQTFVRGKTIINRFLQKSSWVHSFEVAELQQYLHESGFEGFRYELEGIVLTFSANKV